MAPIKRVVSALAVACVLLAGCGTDGSSGGAGSSDRVSVPTVLILDASGSMNEADAPGPRIDAAKAAGQAFVDAMPDDSRMALMTYGTGTGSTAAEKDAGCQDVKTLIPLGPMDRDRMGSEISALRASGYTPISLALQRAVSLLPTDGAPQAIVLVSDGEDTCGAPPCDAAAAAKKSHPGLTISTVGFKTDGPASAELNCIASVTGGMFVQAANANQLAARLTAVQDVTKAKKSLTSTGIQDISLGQSWNDIRSLHPDFPDVSETGTVTVVYVDCDFTFVDGVLDSIAPHGGGSTIDGVKPGSSIGDATELYGKPVKTETNSDGSHNVIYSASADENSVNGYRILVDRYATHDDGTISGLVKTIVLCRCKPTSSAAGTGAGSSAEPEIVVLKPVDAEGDPHEGWTTDDSRRNDTIECSYGTPSPYDVTDGVRFCGATADSGDACWPTSGAYILCLQDPFSNVLHLVGAEGLSTPREPLEDEPIPFGLVLDDGTTCRARIGGSWPVPDERPDLVGWYGCDGARWNAIWGGESAFEKGPDGWTVIVGPSDGHLTEHKVVKAMYVGVA
ncbi:MAG: vWA domain-containing protein [Mycobacterium sp.]